MRGKANKTIDIRLHEEKFYFPGETIKGVVIVHPKSPTKTNHIVVRFSGQVFISVKDKETINLFSKTKILPISTADSKSSHVLDAKQHSFSFEFVVPTGLPSTMEFGKRKARVKYILTAIHDRPMVPESLCSKVSYSVPILELVDVTKMPFIKPQEKSMDILLPGAKYNKKCQTTASMPRFGYTRGEILPLKIVINHFEAFSKQNALEVELVRTVEIRTQKNTATTEDILKVLKQDIKIIGPYNFSQSTTCQLMIPTSTPPTIRYKDKTLYIHYKVRVRVRLGKDGKATVSTLEIPFVVGTWPRADIPIDDDDDDELIQLLGETMLSDDDDDDQDDTGTSDLDRQKTNNSSSSHQKRYSVLSTSSATTLALQKNEQVGRSDSTQSRLSHNSIGSMSSWRSSHSLENSHLSRTTSANMTPIDPQQQLNHGFSRSSTSSEMIYPSSNPLNRSSSTPDLLASPSSQYYGPYGGGSLQHQNTYPMYDTRQSYYDDGVHRVGQPYYQQQGMSPYNNAASLQQQQQQQQHQHIPYSNGNNGSYERGPVSPSSSSSYSPYQHNRMGSEEYQLAGLSSPPQHPPLVDDVPTKVLQPMPSVSTPSSNKPIINRFRTTTATQHQQDAGRDGEYSGNLSGNSPMAESNALSDDDDDDSDDGDLFVIIERKKKQAEREMRQKQRTMYTVAE